MSLALLLGSVPVSAATPEKVIPVLGSYSSGTNIQWAPLSTVNFEKDTGATATVNISVDPSTRYQEYQGLGVSIDETSVSNLWKLSKQAREEAIKKMVDPKDGAGIGLFRITIGSPDTIEHLPFWSYSELPEGVKDDFDLKYFSIQKDIDYHIIETIKLIQSYNPNAQFFASAWSAPAWMTTTNTFTGYVLPKPGKPNENYQASKLRDDCINVFARYYAKFIQAYGEHGINISAITLLNEPGMDVVYPAMDISIEQQQKLSLEIKKVFAENGLDTELWVHDFNFWDWKDPNSTETKNYYRIYEDSADGKIKGKDVLNATDGIAFHPYWGNASVMKDAALEFKGKGIHLTESGSFSSSTIIDFFNQYMNSFTGWTPVTDQNGGTLHWTDARNNNIDWTKVNPSWKNRMLVTNHSTGVASFTSDFYTWGQFGRYLEQGTAKHSGAVRVDSTPGTQSSVSHVTFQNPDGEIVMVIRNSNSASRTVKVSLKDKSFVQTLPGSSTSTLRWYLEDATKGSAVLDGPVNAVAGGTFSLNFGLDGVAKDVLAHDVTVQYDANAVKFVGFDEPPLKENYSVLEHKDDGKGKLRFVSVNLGVKDTKDLLVGLKFAALQTGTANFTVQAQIASDHEEYPVKSASHKVSIKTGVDLTALQALIQQAQTKHDGAVEGTQSGQYPEGSKAVLQTAINKAKAVAANPGTTQQQAQQAITELNAALQTFLQSVRTGTPGDVNGDDQFTIGDLAIVAAAYGKTSQDPDWDTYKKADVNNDGKVDILDLAFVARLILQ
ncbi:glycoside hydrolase family 30 beta sandwich domain-containing protein [Paenibacillus filicis]|uniref:Glycoside hydrolase family 30 beta sandwich domain-containing protein n=1 Tax=Paenibacillus filicis TaxID=669464 RepID=A0ABU9DDZ2_9BACL